MKFLYALFLMVLVIPGSAETITNTMPCADTPVVVQSLREKFNETPIIMGKANDEAQSTMTLWINPTTKTWTIVATKNNLSCIIGVGRNFKLIELGNII